MPAVNGAPDGAPSVEQTAPPMSSKDWNITDREEHNIQLVIAQVNKVAAQADAAGALRGPQNPEEELKDPISAANDSQSHSASQNQTQEDVKETHKAAADEEKEDKKEKPVEAHDHVDGEDNKEDAHNEEHEDKIEVPPSDAKQCAEPTKDMDGSTPTENKDQAAKESKGTGTGAGAGTEAPGPGPGKDSQEQH